MTGRGVGKTGRGPYCRGMTRHPLRLTVAIALVLVWTAPGLSQPASTAPAVRVTFQLNDAFVRDRVLPGVAVEVREPGQSAVTVAGRTNASGQLEAQLRPGTYQVTYRLAGYVPIEGTETDLREDGQVVTTSLSPLLEAAGVGADAGGAAPARRVQIVLNWGSDSDQVRDADSHIVCACDATAHVYFASKRHASERHTIELDVDDVDWGGPETITLTDPPPGLYRYWVHDYSGPPAKLGDSDVVVRVFFGNSLTAEFRPPNRLSSREWRPFAAIEVGEDLEPRIVPLSAADLEAGLQEAAPPGYEGPGAAPDRGCSNCAVGGSGGAGLALLLLGALAAAVVRGRNPRVRGRG